MSKLNIPDNFPARVSYAAAVISAGRRTSRGFDNCFENSDGNAVVAALLRRAEKNPKLAANLPRYINAKSLVDLKGAYAGRNLVDVAREQRAESEARFQAMLAAQDAEKAARASASA